MPDSTTTTENPNRSCASAGALCSGEVYRERPVPKWTMRCHLAADVYAALYRDDILKCQMEVITPRRMDGSPKEESATVSFFLDGDSREFGSQEEMINALMAGPAELWVYGGTTRRQPRQNDQAHP